MTPYSSLAAFLAHYRSLKRLAEKEKLIDIGGGLLVPPDADEALARDELLEEMQKLIDSAGPDVRAALDSPDERSKKPYGKAARHRERAERILRRALLERGALTG